MMMALPNDVSLADEKETSTKPSSNTVQTSLVGPFSISITKSTKDTETWTFFRIPDDTSENDDKKDGVGAEALKALENAKTAQDGFTHQIECRVEYNEDSDSISIDVEQNDDNDTTEEDYELLQTVSKIMIQRAIMSTLQTSKKDTSSMKVVIRKDPFSSVTHELQMDELDQSSSDANEIQQKLCLQLFQLKNDGGVELVDMVDSNGDPLAIVPRNAVHVCNILHRGMGMVICKDVHIHPTTTTTEVYCHRRTDTKRIFPSLYDMFIGGVSTTGEDAIWTAAREAAEELGLKRALMMLEKGENVEDVMKGPLFKCTVCTGYNRCVVTVFTYKVDVEKETFKVSNFLIQMNFFMKIFIQKCFNIFIDYNFLKNISSLHKQ